MSLPVCSDFPPYQGWMHLDSGCSGSEFRAAGRSMMINPEGDDSQLALFTGFLKNTLEVPEYSAG
jgi:hypothetical protein